MAKLTGSLKEQLINILTGNNIINQEQLNSALEVQKQEGGRLSGILVRLKLVKEQDLMLALSKSLHIPPINLSKFRIKEEVINIIPEHVARHYQLIPISKIGENLTIAVSDPLNVFALDDIRALTNFKVKSVLSTEEDIKRAIQHYYAKKPADLIEDAMKPSEKKETKMEMVAKKEEQLDTKTLLSMVNDAPVVKITDLILNEGIQRKASDIFIEPLEKTMMVRYRVDGILQMGDAPPKSMHPAVVTRIKVMSKLKVAEHRLPQDGRFKIQLTENKQEVDFRVSVLPSSMGEKVVLRILDKSTLLLDVDKLGFEQYPLDLLKKYATQPHGMILVTGPTGSGKTTTLYSVLSYVDSIEKNIITAEDPVEYEIDGINQVAVNQEAGLTFAAALRSMLRQDPDIILVGEIRDYETVDVAIKAALTGHLVLTTLHTNDAAGTLARLSNMGVEPFLITASVLMVGAQRLLRALCPACKEPYSPPDELKQRLGVTDKNISFCRPKGCPKCGNSGYKGRIALMEALDVSPRIKELIIKKASEAKIKNTARLEGMTTLRENAMMQAVKGLTSLEEVLRVTAPDELLERS